MNQSDDSDEAALAREQRAIHCRLIRQEEMSETHAL